MTTGEVTTLRRRRILDPDRSRFALQLAILSFVVVVHSDPMRAAAGAMIAAVALMVPGLIEKAWYWWVVTGIMVTWFISEWAVLDNHVALSVYWAAAVALSLSTPSWSKTLARIGRWTIFTVFGLAVFWKIASPDFLSGAFFEWTLLVDPRFEPITSFLGVSQVAMAANRELVASGLTGSLTLSPMVTTAAMALTVGTIVLETGVAVAWAIGERAGDIRHWLLAAFAIVTYVMVPVAGFGFMLLVIGASTVHSGKSRRNYALGALALFVYSLAWNLIVLG